MKSYKNLLATGLEHNSQKMLADALASANDDPEDEGVVKIQNAIILLEILESIERGEGVPWEYENLIRLLAIDLLEGRPFDVIFPLPGREVEKLERPTSSEKINRQLACKVIGAHRTDRERYDRELAGMLSRKCKKAKSIPEVIEEVAAEEKRSFKSVEKAYKFWLPRIGYSVKPR